MNNLNSSFRFHPPVHDRMVTSPRASFKAEPRLDVWIVTHPEPHFGGKLSRASGVYDKKCDAITEATNAIHPLRTWKELYAQGYRARKLSLS